MTYWREHLKRINKQTKQKTVYRQDEERVGSISHSLPALFTLSAGVTSSCMAAIRLGPSVRYLLTGQVNA